jgi:phenylalanyl-tRNA synthetase beta chain
MKSPSNFFYGKGVIQDFLASIGFENLKWREITNPHFEESFQITFKEKIMGVFGMVTKNIRDSFGIDQEVYIAELNWDLLTEMSYANPLRYEEVPKFPLVRRDFALLLDDSISFEKLRLSALKTDCKILKEINLFDVYEGENIEKGKKSYGLSFIFLDKNKTLTDKQVDKVMNKLQNNFEKDFGAQLR